MDNNAVLHRAKATQVNGMLNKGTSGVTCIRSLVPVIAYSKQTGSREKQNKTIREIEKRVQHHGIGIGGLAGGGVQRTDTAPNGCGYLRSVCPRRARAIACILT